MVPLPGGESGETFLATAPGEPTVVRVYGEASRWRGPQAPEVDAAVLRLVRGLVPVASVLEVRRGVDGAPGLLLTTLLPGERLDLVLPGLAAEERATVGRRLGRVAGALSRVPMLRPGLFADGHLRIEDFPEGREDIVSWVAAALDGGAFADWSRSRVAGLREVAGTAGDLVASDRACLVHADLTPTNLLVDPATLEVTGVVDWEYAHAGVPWTDLGNLLRHERDHPFVEGVLGGWLDTAGLVEPPGEDELLHAARAADLVSLVALAARPGAGPAAAAARPLLAAIADRRDLHAHA